MKKKILVVCLIAVLFSFAVILTGHAARGGKTVTISQEEYDRLSRYAKMDLILQYVEAWYYQEPDVDAMIENATRGLL